MGNLFVFEEPADLFSNAAQFYEWAHGRDHHVFDHVYATGKGRFVILVRLFFSVIPNLTVGTFAVPAKIPVRNGLQGKILKAAQQAILFRYFNVLAQDLNRYQSLVRIKQIVFYGRGK